MAKLIIKLNRQGVRQLLRSPEMESCVRTHAEAIGARAEGNYDVSTRIAQTRAVANVRSGDVQTYYRNLKRNYLLKAVR